MVSCRIRAAALRSVDKRPRSPSALKFTRTTGRATQRRCTYTCSKSRAPQYGPNSPADNKKRPLPNLLRQKTAVCLKYELQITNYEKGCLLRNSSFVLRKSKKAIPVTGWPLAVSGNTDYPDEPGVWYHQRQPLACFQQVLGQTCVRRHHRFTHVAFRLFDSSHYNAKLQYMSI